MSKLHISTLKSELSVQDYILSTVKSVFQDFETDLNKLKTQKHEKTWFFIFQKLKNRINTVHLLDIESVCSQLALPRFLSDQITRRKTQKETTEDRVKAALEHKCPQGPSRWGLGFEGNDVICSQNPVCPSSFIENNAGSHPKLTGCLLMLYLPNKQRYKKANT